MLEQFERAHRLLDASTPLIESFGEEGWPIFGVGAVRDHGHDATLAAGGAVGFRITALVGDRRAQLDIRTDIKRDSELRRVTNLAARQIEGDG